MPTTYPFENSVRSCHRLHKKVRLCLLALICGFAALTSSALAEVFKWKDHEGVVHYSSTPPSQTRGKVQNVSAKTMDVTQARAPAQKPAPPPTAQELENTVSDLERQVDAERQARQQAEAQSAAAQSAYEQALANQQAMQNYIPSVPAAVWIPPQRFPPRNGVNPPHHRPRPTPQPSR